MLLAVVAALLALPLQAQAQATGICGRTEQVRDAIVGKISGVTACADVTGTHLAAITGTLNLSSDGIAALAAGDFDGLTALTLLRLNDNSLETLPAGVFDKLTALTQLALYNNSLTTLPAGAFAELTALTSLWLDGNSLTTLPAGAFEELTALTTLRLDGNPGAPFSPTADALPDDGTVVDAGGDVTLDGSGSDGGPWGTNVTYSWAASGAAVTFDDAASATPVVTIPALAAGTELTFTLTVTGRATNTTEGSARDTDTATVTVFDPTAGICGRTEQVRTAILARISGVTHCALVTDAHLAAITGSLDLRNENITALAAGDFDGLTALTSLWLQDNSLSTLPDDVFEELTALTSLRLDGNPGAPFSPTAVALPDDGTIFPFLVESVALDGSGSDGGPWGTNVTYSWLQTSGEATLFNYDRRSATTVVPIYSSVDGDELTFTLTVTGRATNASWGSAPDTDTATVTVRFDLTAGICGRTEELRDHIVGRTSGVTHCRDVTDAHLAAITGTLGVTARITAFAAGDFDGLTAVTTLNLDRNGSLTTLPAGVFDGLTALTGLSLSYNLLETLPAGVFDGLTALTGLSLSHNPLETLPVGVFDGLTALTTLRLERNSLTTLPAGVFDGLTALTSLYLDNTSLPTTGLSTLPTGVFDGLTALRTLALRNNSLSTLPDDVFEELTALTSLRLDGNPGAPFSPTADALPDDGTVLPAGGTVTLDGSGSGGPWGTNVTYSWALTAPTSGVTVTFDDAASATPVVTIPALALGTELTFTLTVTGRATNTSLGSAPATDTATVTVFDPTAGICGRTEAVRDAIVARISGVTACADVTDAHLAAITGNTLNLETEGITALAAGDFDGLTALTELSLKQNSLETLPVGVFDELTSLTYLILQNNSLTTLPAGVFDGLTSLTWLQLSGNSLETLPAGVFDELTALTRLWLTGNSLTTLPAGVFDKLTALTELWLANNSLPTLPAGVFDELTALTTLILNDNSLTALPAGVFDKLTALTTLRLQDNPGAPFSPTADALPDDGTVPAAGGDVTLDGSGSDGGPWGTNVTYSWAAGGAPVTFDDAASATPVVTIPALAAGIELTFTLTVTGRATNASNGSAPDTDIATVTAVVDPTAGICGRTKQVRDAIVARISGVVSCADVTDTQLAAITGTLNLNSDGITALAAGDFDGLTALMYLDLGDNSLSTLPAGVFDQLTALPDLNLSGNSLSTLPAGVFDGLTALTTLRLQNNSLSTLPAGVFDQLTAVTNLLLHDNTLSTLPAGVFDELTALTTLRLYDNLLSTLPAGVFDELTALTDLWLQGNFLSTLPAGVFDELTALTELELNGNSLSTLPAGVFDELTALTTLNLSGNSLSTLPAGVFDELTALTTLRLEYNTLSTLPAGVFDELTALDELWLQINPGAPFSPTADALPDDGEVSFAGGDVTLDGSGSDGGPWGTNVTYSWAASGATVTFDDAASATPVVTIPALAEGTELTFTLTVTGRATNTTLGSAPDTDTATVTAVFDATAGICGRTEEVRDAIVGEISGVTHCALVTDAHLAAITGTLDLESKNITALAAGDFDGLTALTTLNLFNTSLSTLPAGVFDGLTALDRLLLHGNSLSTLPAGVFDGLTALTNLELGVNSLSTLPAGVFDGLTALTQLRLDHNSLSTLPVGVFDELTALTRLDLRDNSLSTLPAGVFEALTALTDLSLRDNSLSTLPAGVFEALTALTDLSLQGNPGAPFSPTAVALPDDGEVVVGPGGTVTLDGSDGGPWGTNVTYSWAASGATVTFDDAASATPVVTIPVLADGTELTFTLTVTGRATNTSRGTAPATDTATVTAVFDSTAGICGRTEEVRTAIVGLISGVASCADVTDAQLAAITGTLRLGAENITALAVGDFDGLTALTTLRLRGNSLSTLPAGVFDKLTALTTLDLRNNSLSTLPAGVFEELTALTTLRLDGNLGAPFAPTADALPDDGEVLDAGGDVTLDGSGSDGGPWGTNVTYSWAASGAAVTFDDAASATPVVTIPALADGTELTFTLTVTGRATNASFGSAPATDTATVTAEFDPTAGICGRTEVVRDRIVNQISGVTHCALVTDVHLAAITGILAASPAGITALAAGDFDGLTALTQLWLHSNSLSTLPAGVFDDLTALTTLILHNNDLTALPAGVFNDLTALTTLELNNNDLSTLDDDVFEPLTALTQLRLQGNPGAPFAPTADALPDDGTVPVAGGDVTLDGSGSDGGPWGTNVTYSWAASGATVTFDDAASATPVVTIPALAAGTELTFTLTVTGRAHSAAYGSARDTDTATVTAVGVPELSFAPNSVTVNEDAVSATLTVELDPASTGTVTVDYATRDGVGAAKAGEDYTATSGTLTFAATETSKTFTVPILDDDVYENNESFSVDLTNPTGATLVASGATVRIDSEDAVPTASMEDVTVDEGAGTMTLTLRLSHPSDADITYLTSARSLRRRRFAGR